jgi:hypothetical protein
VRIELRPSSTSYGLGDLAPVDLPIRSRSASNCSNSPLLGVGVGVVVGNEDINVSAVVAVELSAVALLVRVLAEVVSGVLVRFLFFSRFNGRGLPLLLGSFVAQRVDFGPFVFTETVPFLVLVLAETDARLVCSAPASSATATASAPATTTAATTAAALLFSWSQKPVDA